ncbi:class II histocompatibility antigen, B-L beta chain-like [Lonchura striata]
MAGFQPGPRSVPRRGNRDGLEKEGTTLKGPLGDVGRGQKGLVPTPELLQGECRVKKQKRPLHGTHRYHGTDTPGTAARYCNSDPHVMEQRRTAVGWLCRYNHEYLSPFLTERRVTPTLSISLLPSSSQPSPGHLLCSLVDFYPAHTQLRWFQGQQELSVVATDMVPKGDWTHQLLVLLETSTRAGLTSTCQVEHVSLEHPLSQHWEDPRDAAGCCHSKMLAGTGDSELGFIFLALGIWFYLHKKGGSRESYPTSPRM